MSEKKLVGQNYSTADLRAKVTGRARYAEDFRAPGMLFARLLLSPFPHARVISIDASKALAMPGVKAILTADEVPGPKDQVNDAGQVIRANLKSEKALTNEPLYQEHYGVALAKRFHYNKPPTILDAPTRMAWAAVELPDPETPVGARGIGEPPVAAGCAAVLNAISAALGDEVFRRAPVNLDGILTALEAGTPMLPPLTANV